MNKGVNDFDRLVLVCSKASLGRPGVQALIERANAAGGRDNVSVVLVLGDRYSEAVRRRKSGPAKAAAARPSLRGAGHVRGGGAKRVVLTLLFLALLAAGLFLFRGPLLDALNFGYVVKVAKGRPGWAPVQVFDDGRKTFIRFPPAMLNRVVPELTREMVGKIFATDFEDWPALLRAMRETGKEFREGKIAAVYLFFDSAAA